MPNWIGPEGEKRRLDLAERDGAEKSPLERADEAVEESVEAVEEEEGECEARVGHRDVEGEARLIDRRRE